MLKKILIVEYQYNWRNALSELFRCHEKIKKQRFCIEESSCFDDAIDKLENNDYDLIIINDILEPTTDDNTFDVADKSPGIYLYKGLIVFKYLNEENRFKNRFKNTLKILLKTKDLDYPRSTMDNYKQKYKEKYGLDYVYIFEPEQISVDFMDEILNLFDGKLNQHNLITMEQFTNGYALLIGVGYDKDLPATVNDANNLHDVLVDPRLAAYPRQQVQVLTKEASTKDNILSGLKDLANQVRENPEATVWIYYSGHGLLREETYEYFLIPYNYESQNIQNTCISNQDWSEEIKKIKSKKLMVWLDCCHAEGMLSKELDKLPFRESPPPKGVFEGLDSGSGRVVIASCKENQKSYILPGATNSVFTTCLLEVLQGQGLTDSDDEYIRFFQIMSYLYKKVPELVKTKSQNPILVSGEGIDDNFAVCCRPSMRVATSQTLGDVVQTDKEQARTVIEQQIFESRDTLKLLNKKIGTLERQDIISASPTLKFELAEELSKLKAQREAINKEIENLEGLVEDARRQSES